MREETVTLSVFTWAGRSAGATHYYGELRGYVDGEYHHVNRVRTPLGRARALSLNRKFRAMYSDDRYRMSRVQVGWLDDRYDTIDEVVEAAKKVWLRHYPEANTLMYEVYDTEATVPIAFREDWDGPIEPIPPGEERNYEAWGLERVFDKDSYPEDEPEEIAPSIIDDEALFEEEEETGSSRPIIDDADKAKLEDFPYIDITIRIHDMSFEKNRRIPGSSITCFKSFVTQVLTDDREHEIGSLSGGTGYLCLDMKDICPENLEKKFRSFLSSHENIWLSFAQAVKDADANNGWQYLPEEEDHAE